MLLMTIPWLEVLLKRFDVQQSSSSFEDFQNALTAHQSSISQDGVKGAEKRARYLAKRCQP